MTDQKTRPGKPGLIPDDGALAESLRKRMSLAGRRVASETVDEDNGGGSRFVFSAGQREAPETTTGRVDGNVVLEESTPSQSPDRAGLDRYKSPMFLAQMLVIMLAIQAGYFVATLIAEYAHVAANLGSTHQWGPFELFLFPLTAAGLVAWTYRLYTNLDVFGVVGLSTRPVLAAVLVALPVVNLITPPVIFNEVWCATNPRVDCREGESWRKSGANVLIPLWWLTFMAAIGLRIAGNLQIAWATQASTAVVCYLTFAASAVLGIASIWRISVRQEDKQLLLRAGVEEA